MSEIKEFDAILRSHLSWFIRKVFQTVAPGETYLHAWYIDAMAYELERVFRGVTMRFAGAETKLDADELRERKEHEKRALGKLKQSEQEQR